MRHKAVPAATMIVAASLIGITQARLPRPIRDYRERVSVEMSPYDLEKGRLIFRHKDERAASSGRPPQRQQFRRR